MNKKIIRSFLLTTSLTIGLSMSVITEAHAETYTAVNGDSLYKISRAFNTSVANLMVANNFTDYDLNIGQVLNVPCESYTVKKGDTLYKISQMYDIPLINLRRANNIFTNYIYVGQKLEIPLQTTNKLSSTKPDNTVSSEPDTSAKVPTTDVEATEPEKAEETQAPVTDYSAEELDLLARLIMAETEGQPYEAKVAVGSVVMNRVKSGLFAPTISGVINQNINGYYQFTPVENGWINRKANDECIRAAKEALSGVDNTNGALFYYDDSTTNQWILSKPVSIKYGNMIYVY